MASQRAQSVTVPPVLSGSRSWQWSVEGTPLPRKHCISQSMDRRYGTTHVGDDFSAESERVDVKALLSWRGSAKRKGGSCILML